MKTVKFDYMHNAESKPRHLLVMDENDNHVAGLDLSLMNDEDKKVVLDAVEEMYKKIKPFMKYYRNFLRENITTQISEQTFKSH